MADFQSFRNWGGMHCVLIEVRLNKLKGTDRVARRGGLRAESPSCDSPGCSESDEQAPGKRSQLFPSPVGATHSDPILLNPTRIFHQPVCRSFHRTDDTPF